MFSWIAENLATILVALVLAGIVAVIIVGMVRDKKKGKSSCGGHCAGCAMHGACHQKKN